MRLTIAKFNGEEPLSELIYELVQDPIQKDQLHLKLNTIMNLTSKQ